MKFLTHLMVRIWLKSLGNVDYTFIIITLRLEVVVPARVPYTGQIELFDLLLVIIINIKKNYVE